MTESIKDMGVSGKYTRMEHPTALHLLPHLLLLPELIIHP
jgi:hypothetical protein